MSSLVVLDDVTFRVQTAVQLEPGTTWRVEALEMNSESRNNDGTILSGHGQQPREGMTVPIVGSQIRENSRHDHLTGRRFIEDQPYPAIYEKVLDKHI